MSNLEFNVSTFTVNLGWCLTLSLFGGVSRDSRGTKLDAPNVRYLWDPDGPESDILHFDPPEVHPGDTGDPNHNPPIFDSQEVPDEELQECERMISQLESSAKSEVPHSVVKSWSEGGRHHSFFGQI